MFLMAAWAKKPDLASRCHTKLYTASTRETTKTPLSLILEPERKIQPLS